MLEILIGAIIRSEEPAREDFQHLVTQIESKPLFEEETTARDIDQRDVGNFRVYKKESMFGNKTIYEIYQIPASKFKRECGDKDSSHFEELFGRAHIFSNRGQNLQVSLKGYEIVTKKGNVEKYSQKENVLVPITIRLFPGLFGYT